jgi:hypothetical protein
MSGNQSSGSDFELTWRYVGKKFALDRAADLRILLSISKELVLSNVKNEAVWMISKVHNFVMHSLLA